MDKARSILLVGTLLCSVVPPPVLDRYERDYGVHMLLVSQKQLKLMLRLQFFDQGGTTPVMRAYATSWPMCSLA